MWLWLPDEVVRHLAELVHPQTLAALALLERRCRLATVVRRTTLGRLRLPPFRIDGPTIVGAPGAQSFVHLNLNWNHNGREPAPEVDIQDVGPTSYHSGGLFFSYQILINGPFQARCWAVCPLRPLR